MAIGNTVNNFIFSPSGAVNLTGYKFPSSFQSGFTINATTDIYTCPSQKRAILYPCYGANYNATPGGVTLQAKVKSSGNYYIISQSNSISQNGLITTPSQPIILEAGESGSATVSSSTTLNMGFPILEFDQTCPIKSVKLFSFVNGNNTLYTCPSNKQAFILDINVGVAIGTGLGQLFYSNASGGNVTRQWYIVNNGGSPGTSNSTSASFSVGNGILDISGTSSSCLNAGDSIVINTNSATAGQIAWVNIMEISI